MPDCRSAQERASACLGIGARTNKHNLAPWASTRLQADPLALARPSLEQRAVMGRTLLLLLVLAAPCALAFLLQPRQTSGESAMP
jgi:hypothetical protein